MTPGSKHPIDLEMRWNFGDSRSTSLSLDDLSQRAVKLVIEYCLEVLEEVEKIIRGKATLARLEAALDLQYAEQFENKVFQYRWALRHPVVKEAITRAMGNRFPSR
jgi:rRNA-processing protein FCF1